MLLNENSLTWIAAVDNTAGMHKTKHQDKTRKSLISAHEYSRQRKCINMVSRVHARGGRSTAVEILSHLRNGLSRQILSPYITRSHEALPWMEYLNIVQSLSTQKIWTRFVHNFSSYMNIIVTPEAISNG